MAQGCPGITAKYTAPPWGGEYPFVEMVSTFLPYYPDIDFMKGTYMPNRNLPMTNYNIINRRIKKRRPIRLIKADRLNGVLF
jgi:hypothetical protein